MFTRTVALLTALAFSAGTARADEPKKAPVDEEVKAAQERLTEFLKDIKGAEAARVTAMGPDGISKAFPDHVLFTVLFPQYPIARIAPPPLKSSNVVAVPKKK